MSGKRRHFIYIFINIIMLLGYTLGVFIAGVFVSHAYAPALSDPKPPRIVDSLPNLGQPNTAYETVFIGGGGAYSRLPVG